MKTKIFTLLFALIGSANILFAYNESCSGMCGTGLEWTIPDDTECRLKIEGLGSMFNYTLDRIPTYQYCCQITAISLPNGLVNIGDFAFANITTCDEIVLPATVKFIGKGAFMNSTNLYVNRIWSPNIISVGDSAFYGCRNLLSLSGLIKDTVRTATFYNAGVTLSQIPFNVKYISDFAFAKTNVGPSLIIPANVQYIGDSAFHDCRNLTSVTIDSEDLVGQDYSWRRSLGAIFGEQTKKYIIGDSVTRIGYNTFYKCKSLETIVIGKNVTSMGGKMFPDCYSLKEIIWNAVNCSDFSGINPLGVVSDEISISFGEDVIHIPAYLLSHRNNYFTYDTPPTKEVIIPNSVISIGERAFENRQIKKLVLSDSLQTIGALAFYDNRSTSSIVIPDGVREIGVSAFKNVPNIEYHGNATGAPWGAKCLNGYVDGWLVYRDSTKTELMACNIQATGDIVLPNSVTSIGDYAFEKCTRIKTITIPSSTINIGNWAFAYCDSLISITLPSNGTGIGKSAFYNCVSLTSINIPDGITAISEQAFSYCSSLKQVSIPSSVVTIGSSAFSHCTSLPVIDNIRYADTYLVEAVDKTLSEYNIKVGTRFIGNSAFDNCKNLSSIFIPSSIISIDASFGLCDSLTSVLINDIYSWCNISFGGPSANPLMYAHDLYLDNQIIKNLVIPNGITTIGNYTFCGSSITSVVFPDGINSIGKYAFYRSSITSVVIPEGVTTIGIDAFSKCDSLISVTLPSSLSTIDWYAFNECSGLTSILFPDALSYIGKYAFYKCSGLTSVTFTNPLLKIEEYAFGHCTGLSSVTSSTITPAMLAKSTFYNVDTSIPLYVPAGSEELYRTTPIWQNFNPILPIPHAIEVGTGVIQAEAQINSVVLDWTADSEAATYTIEIKQDQTTVCTLVFDAQGHLESNAYNAPARKSNSIPQQKAIQTSTGWQYTIGGLEANTEYTYTVVARRNDYSEVYNTTVQFRTQATTIGLDQIINDKSKSIKFLRDGHILILRGGKVYTLQGQEVR